MSINNSFSDYFKRGKYALIGDSYADFLKNSLKLHDITTVSVPNNPYVDQRLRGHVDLSLFHSGEGELFASNHLANTEFEANMQKIGVNLRFIGENIGEKYPCDSLLNICKFGNRLICNPKSASKDIVNYFKNTLKSEIIPVKQGYTGCSVCVVDENTVITADRGVCSKLIKFGFDVLLINEGYITLDGFDYGFIGGATFKLNNETLAFTGRFDDHPDKERIIDFLERHNVKPVYLTDEKLFDIGGGIVI